MSPSLSPPDQQLIDRLRAAQGDPLSGQVIGELLSISRAAVWKRIEGLRRAGFQIESLSGQGYRLIDEPDTPTSEAVGACLIRDQRSNRLFSGEKLHFFESLDSTNEQATLLARQGAEEGSVVVADHQTRGRGRMGRVWDSPVGLNLYFSMILRPAVEPRYASQLTLLTGLALAETVGAVGVDDVQIKWPNDLLFGGKKVAGILTEMAIEENRVRFIIVGVGVNVNAELADLSPEIADIATTLRARLKIKVKRSVFLADFLGRFQTWYDRYLAEGFAPLRSVWLERSRIQGRRVQVNLLKDSFAGEAIDLDVDGFLVVKRDDTGRESRVLAGDVHLLEC